MRTRQNSVKRLDALIELQEVIKQQKKQQQFFVSEFRLFPKLVRKHQAKFNRLSKIQHRVRQSFNEVLTELKPY